VNTETFEKWLEQRTAAVLQHRGLGHSVFDSLPRYCHSKVFLQAVLRQIYHVVLGFPFHIAGAIATTRDENLLDVLSRNLYSEIGGDKGERHIDIYRRMLRALNLSEEPPQITELWTETIELESLCSESYSNRNIGVKLGALFAFELMSSPMVCHWDRALKEINWLTPYDYSFFTIHIDIEASHAVDIANSCLRYWNDAAFQNAFDQSSEEVMYRLELFWNKVEECGLKSLSHPFHTKTLASTRRANYLPVCE
jgi:pyrroloquinoline quinone (PQQ) biosynthesis protein C